jgi:LysM repeat protein
VGRLRLVAERLRRNGATRYAAPAVFLLAATIAVLLIRSAIHHDRRTTTSDAAPTIPKRKTAVLVKPATPVTSAPVAQYHTIESGDTFGALAARYGTTVDRLRLLNPDVDPAALRVGAKIRIH